MVDKGGIVQLVRLTQSYQWRLIAAGGENEIECFNSLGGDKHGGTATVLDLTHRPVRTPPARTGSGGEPPSQFCKLHSQAASFLTALMRKSHPLTLQQHQDTQQALKRQYSPIEEG